ncbi:MAG: VWA domain-containing protein [Myxococcota bacterium]|nr:VWA domain-containing protein [Myxococcota bacterium]
MELTGLGLGQVLAVTGAFGAAVVVLYLLKLRRRPIEVPFVRLWHDVLAEERTTRLFSTLKRILSLLLALAIVAMLALALGDPRWTSADDDDGSTQIVLVDASASMGATDVAGGRMEAAREEVRRRIAAMGASDRMIIASMGTSAVPLGPIDGDPQVLEAALAQLEPLDVAADLGRGLGWALDVARSAARPEIVIVSDGHLDDPGEAIARRATESEVPIRWARVGRGGDDVRNVAITAFAVRRYPIDKSRAQLLVELWNPGAQAEDVELTLLGDGAPIDVTTLRVGAGERMPRVFENVTGADRTLEARIRFADGTRDALAADDVAYARLPERRRARVVVVAEDDIYLSAALLLDEYLEVVEVTPAQFPPEGRFDVAIFESFVPREPYDADTIYLHPLPPEGVQGPLAIEGTIASPFFDRLLRDHPLLRFTSLRDVNIAEALHVRTEPGDVVVGADAQGPLLVTGTRNERRFVALTFDPRQSDLPLRIAWPLILLNAIDSFTEAQSGHHSSHRTGEPWYVPVPAGATRATLVDPDERRREVPIVLGRAVASGTRAGFYALESELPSGETDSQLLAANLGPSSEAELRVPDSLAIAGEPAEPPARVSIAVRSEPWAWLVLAAFTLLAIEWITFHRRWTL